MAEQVFDLYGDIIGEPGPFAMESFDDSDSVAGAVEEVRVAKGDVLRTRRDLTTDILQYDISLHNPENAAVHRDHRTVAAQMFAAARCLGVAHALGAVGGHKLRVST